MIAARETCHRLGVPHVTLDLREEFRRAVVAPFVRGYARGETPNPCTRCNGGFRFAELLAFARRAGAECLATGHYARVVERDGRLLLARGLDPAKDQSYMLASLDPRHLARVSFPLATKPIQASANRRMRVRSGASASQELADTAVAESRLTRAFLVCRLITDEARATPSNDQNLWMVLGGVTWRGAPSRGRSIAHSKSDHVPALARRSGRYAHAQGSPRRGRAQRGERFGAR